jgi:hypothetical protein
MASKLDALSVVLVSFAVAAFAFGLSGLGERVDLGAVYWLIAGGFALSAASERERFVAAR